MKEYYHDIDVLIAKVLAGEADADEQEFLHQWQSQSPDNQHHFESLQKLWDLSANARTAPRRTVNTEKALERVKARLQDQSVPMRSKRGGNMRFWIQAVAACALLIAAFFLLQQIQPGKASEITAASDAILVDTLKDGSIVTLNRNSGLTVSSHFNKKERRMQLHGEAYFEVAHDQSKPFVIEIQKIEIQAVGTAFNVDNATEPGKITVTVTEGKVLVRTPGEQIFLAAGEEVVYDIVQGKLSKNQIPQNPNTLAYKTRAFQFDGTPLGAVVQQMQNAYGVRILLKNKGLENCPLSGRYNDLPLKRLLDLIAETFNLNLSQLPDGQYVLDGTGCGE
ncbi:MAG: FecR domain-containing protein [Bacteroidetes bacterium]|nr:FecR domain-containing protein [Bacteroidota bacterium]